MDKPITALLDFYLLSWQLKQYVHHTGEMHFGKTGNVHSITAFYFMAMI